MNLEDRVKQLEEELAEYRRIKSNEEYYKRQIVHNVLQATRVKVFGHFLDDENSGIKQSVSSGEVDFTIDFFLKKALTEGFRWLSENTQNV